MYVKIILGNESRVVSKSDYDKVMEVAGEMVEKAGGGVPRIVDCDEHGNEASSEPQAVSPDDFAGFENLPPPEVEVENNTLCTECQEVEPESGKTLCRACRLASNSPVFSNFNGDLVTDQNGKSRVESLYDKLEETGVTGILRDKTTMGYAPGTRMADIGYSTQAKRKIAHEKKLPLREAIAALNHAITSERRRDIDTSAGELARTVKYVNGKLLVGGEFCLRDHAVRGLFTRLNSFSKELKASGQSRILELQERIIAARSMNEKNRMAHLSEYIAKYSEVEQHIANDEAELVHCLEHELRRFPEVRLKLRTRESLRDIFAVVSPTYGIADAPMLTPRILAGGVPDDARGDWGYNPETTAWHIDVATWTSVETMQQVIGEPTSGMVEFSGRDDGTGRINGSGGINIIACLNASLYTADSVEVSRVHRGNNVLWDVEKMLKTALKSINTLSEAWGNNRKIVIEPSNEDLAKQSSEFIAALWRAQLNDNRELVNVLPGRKENHIKALTNEYFDQRRDKNHIVRADFGQAFTHYIKSISDDDVRHESELAIGSWLVNPRKMMPEYLEKK